MTVPDHDASVRRRSVAMAGHRHDDPVGRGEAVVVARAALGDGEGAVRATGLGALSRLGDLRLDDVEAAAADPSPVVRVRAAELACRFGAAAVDAAVGVLVGLLHDPQAEVVEAACFGLGEVGQDAAPAVEALAAVAALAGGHPDPLCREAAVAAIGAIGAPAGLAAVLAAMADKPAVRRRAVLALASFDGPEVEAALDAARTDRDWQVRQAAEDLTGRRPRPTS